MLNRELILYDGTKVYPQYLTPEDRENYAKRFKDKSEFMKCGCRTDVSLWYRFSVTGACYPEHKNYVHSKYCIYSTLSRRVAAMMFDPENGETRVFLNFKPSTFTVPTDAEVDRSGSGKEEKEKEEDDRFFPLERFVHQLNCDTWNSRMAAGEKLISAPYFNVSLFGRLKNIVIDGLKKPLRDYTLQQDSFCFFYQAFNGYEIKEGGNGYKTCNLVINGSDGKRYTWFVYEKTLNVALKRFYRMYDKDPNDMIKEGGNVIMSGFRYLRKKKGSDIEYKVVGRLCFFAVNKCGIIGRSCEELKALDNICEILRWNKDDVKYYMADEWESFSGYFEKKGDMAKYIITADAEGLPGGNVMQVDIVEHAPSVTELKSFLKLGGQG